MPFTPSHIAAVLPLARSPLVPSALVLGSMAPDVPYYLPVPMPGSITHTAPATVGVDVLLGLALYLLWHGVLAGPALAAAPSGLVVRVPAAPRFGERVRSVRVIAWTALSCSLGSMTHVGWDEFTHGGRWGTRHVAWLAESHGPLAGFRWAQYASGLVGALVARDAGLAPSAGSAPLGAADCLGFGARVGGTQRCCGQRGSGWQRTAGRARRAGAGGGGVPRRHPRLVGCRRVRCAVELWMAPAAPADVQRSERPTLTTRLRPVAFAACSR